MTPEEKAEKKSAVVEVGVPGKLYRCTGHHRRSKIVGPVSHPDFPGCFWCSQDQYTVPVGDVVMLVGPVKLFWERTLPRTNSVMTGYYMALHEEILYCFSLDELEGPVSTSSNTITTKDLLP